MPRRVFITAAEASGDQHAAELARSLRELDGQVLIEGIGGPKMAGAGVIIHHETVGKAAMGWRGALRVFEVRRWMNWVREHYRRNRPDLHICVDSSAMNLPFAKLAKGFGVPVMYYIAPQLWASREGRMKKLRRDVDHVACILPFEEEYFRSHGVKATYVGHPLFDELPRDRGRGEGARFPDAPPVIGIIPGSRRGEVKANLPHLIEVMGRIGQEVAGTRFVVPTTEATDGLVRVIVSEAASRHGLEARVTMEQDRFDNLVRQCDLCLVKSGTSTLHVAAWGVPMIVVYRINPLAWHLAGRWLVKTKKIALVSILAGNTDLVPEFVPWYGSNEPVAACAIDMLKHPEKLAEQRRKLGELIAKLDKPGASSNAGKMAMEMMGLRAAASSC